VGCSAPPKFLVQHEKIIVPLDLGKRDYEKVVVRRLITSFWQEDTSNHDGTRRFIRQADTTWVIYAWDNYYKEYLNPIGEYRIMQFITEDEAPSLKDTVQKSRSK
jgi:hypothetical protein